MGKEVPHRGRNGAARSSNSVSDDDNWISSLGTCVCAPGGGHRHGVSHTSRNHRGCRSSFLAGVRCGRLPLVERWRICTRRCARWVDSRCSRSTLGDRHNWGFDGLLRSPGANNDAGDPAGEASRTRRQRSSHSSGNDMTKYPIYLDFNATTPVHPIVLEAMLPFFGPVFGNPSSAHPFGFRLRAAMDTARGQVAALIGAQEDEIVFTSCGSESNNLALKGLAFAGEGPRNHIIISAVEHPAVSNTARFL